LPRPWPRPEPPGQAAEAAFAQPSSSPIRRGPDALISQSGPNFTCACHLAGWARTSVGTANRGVRPARTAASPFTARGAVLSRGPHGPRLSARLPRTVGGAHQSPELPIGSSVRPAVGRRYKQRRWPPIPRAPSRSGLPDLARRWAEYSAQQLRLRSGTYSAAVGPLSRSGSEVRGPGRHGDSLAGQGQPPMHAQPDCSCRSCVHPAGAEVDGSGLRPVSGRYQAGRSGDVRARRGADGLIEGVEDREALLQPGTGQQPPHIRRWCHQ
jgi:hypothetical protein